MDDPSANPTAPSDPPQIPGSALGSNEQLPQPSQPPQGSADNVDNWTIIGEQKGFYDEQDCLHPSRNLTSEKLSNRRKDDVVIFNYSLDPEYLKHVDGNLLVEEGSPSSERFSADDDIFSRVPKDQLIESEQFKQIINLTNEPREILAPGQRLHIM